MSKRESTELRLARAEVKWRERDFGVLAVRWRAARSRAEVLCEATKAQQALLQDARKRLAALEGKPAGEE